MTDGLRKLRYTPLLILYALWVTLFYQLVFVAWTVEYSYYGVAAVIAASLLFVYAFPKKDRRIAIRFTLFSLMASYALASFVNATLFWHVVDYIVFVVLALALGGWLVGLRKTQLLLVIAALAVVEFWLPLKDMSVLSAFQVRYIGHMASPDPQLSSIPAVPVPDPKNPGHMEILTMRGHHPIKGEAQMLIDLLANPKYAQGAREAIQELQYSYDILGVRPGRLRFVTHYASAAALRKVPFSSLGLIDFPFTTVHFLSLQNQTRMYVSLSATPGQLLTDLLSPGTLADSMGNLSLKTAQTTQANWDQVSGRQAEVTDGLTISDGYLNGKYNGRRVHVKTTGVAILGIYPMLPQSVSSAPQAVVEGNNLIQVVSLPPNRPRVLATLKGSYTHPLTTDIVFADLTGNHYDAMLINTVPAQIVQLSPHGRTWHTLWISGRSSFRFESVFHRSGGDLIIANSPSLVSYSPIRYLGGYIYKNHQLERVFRVYHGNLVNLHALRFQPHGQQNLLTSVYANQEIMVLSPTKIPWLPLSAGIYGLVILFGISRRLIGRKTA